MVHIKENIYDVSTQQRYKIVYNSGNDLVKINRKLYRNKLYFFDDYTTMYNRDFLWITNDDKIIHIDDEIVELIVSTDNFIKKLRILKTEYKILNYITFLRL